MRKILLILILFSFSFNFHIPGNDVEYSVGINDKTGLFGWFSKNWITDKPYGESYIAIGGIGIAGSVGYGQRYYFSRGRFFSSYISWTGFGYYILPMTENKSPLGSLALSGNLGLDFTPIKWNNNEIKLQFGLLASYDPLRGENLIISADNGPSFLFPSVNIQLRFQR